VSKRIPRLGKGRYLILSDIQAPLHSERHVAGVTSWLAQQDDISGILCVGDEADQTEVSRWTRGTSLESQGTLEAGLLKTHEILRDFASELPDGAPFIMQRSNHTDRIANYIAKYAPGFINTSWNDFPAIMGYGTPSLLAGTDNRVLPITWSARPYEFSEGWVMAHGDEGGGSRFAGGTALGLARRWNRSVVCGHTHKMGHTHEHRIMNGEVNQHLFGVEVGNLMDLDKASYLKGGSANWQSGFAIADIGEHTTITNISIVDNRFHVDGTEWKI
jgi:hypothetical protein